MYRLLVALLLSAWSAALQGKARAPVLGAELRLPLADPMVTARIGDVALRLRVDFDQRDSIELNPEAAARLPLAFEAGGDAEVGRVVLPGRMAITRLSIEGQRTVAQLATHGWRCCEDADGIIGAALLPFEIVRLTAASPAPERDETTYPMSYSKEEGLQIRQDTPAGAVLVQLSLRRAGPVATKAAGVILARAYGGQFDKAYSHMIGPFGVERPVRALRLARPVTLAGFRLDRLQVRSADFGGRRVFPGEEARPGDIVVRKRVRAHHDWPSVLIGREYLGGCSELVFRTVTRTISLACPADAAPSPSPPF